MDFKKVNIKGKKEENPFSKQDKRNLWELITDNKKVVMPVVLVAAVGLTIGIALNANKNDASSVQEETVTTVNEDGSYVVPDVELEKNAYEDVNALMQVYFDAYSKGDMDTIKSIYVGLESTEELRLQEVSQYITGIPTIDIYTKPGPVDGSYVVYAYTEVLFEGYDTPLPGMQTMYVCTDENGNLYINGDVVDDRVTEYISNISLQADVVDLNNNVAVQYNDIIAANESLATFLSDMSANIQVSVGEALAAIESGEGLSSTGVAAVTAEDAGTTTDENAEAATDESTDTAAEGTEAATDASAEAATDEAATDEAAETATEETTEDTASATKQIKATDVVNIRASDSETADKLGKTEVGEVFTQLEELENGWSKIEYDGGEAYVKTSYFEVVTEDTASEEVTATEETTEDTEETTEETGETTEDESTEEADTESSSKVDAYATGKMRVSETVRLRKSQSTDADVLDTIYAGNNINVIEQYANGWAKVEYNGDTGYIKSEYLMN